MSFFPNTARPGYLETAGTAAPRPVLSSQFLVELGEGRAGVKQSGHGLTAPSHGLPLHVFPPPFHELWASSRDSDSSYAAGCGMLVLL